MRIPISGVTTRDVTLIEGPGGWGEISLMPQFSSQAEEARQAAIEAATEGFPQPLRNEIPVSVLIPAVPPEVAAELAVSAVHSQFSAVKVKVGDDADIERVAAVRNVIGPNRKLRVDANGAWDGETAFGRISAMQRFSLEFVEQPVMDWDELAHLHRSIDVPIAVDEMLCTAHDVSMLQAYEAADIVILKVQAHGGVRKSLELAQLCGLPAVVTSMLGTSVDIAMGAALAAALPELPYACGLATLRFLDGDVTDEPLEPVEGILSVRDVKPAPALLEKYRAPG